MKNFSIICLMVISLFILNLNVYAMATNALPGDDNYSELQSSYDKGIVKTDVTNSSVVTIYGKSDCNGTSCTVSYAGGKTDYEDVLKQSINCINGEKSITAQVTGTSGKRQYAESNEAKYNGIVYWSEEYHVTCTNNGTVTLENVSNSGAGNNFNSSTTVENEQTGVNTYFIVLGTVAVMSYGIMLLVKKYNLFKNI